MLTLDWTITITAPMGGHIFKLWANKISSLSYMKNMARKYKPHCPFSRMFPRSVHHRLWCPLYPTGRAHTGGKKYGGRTPVAPNPGSIMGIHNCGISRGQALWSPPSAIQALIGASINHIYRFDRDQLRERNNHYLDPRAGHFSH
jgi:hypothetical protein